MKEAVYLGDVLDPTEFSGDAVEYGDVAGKAVPFIAARNARIITPPLGGGQLVPLQEMEAILAEVKRKTPSIPYTQSINIASPNPAGDTITNTPLNILQAIGAANPNGVRWNRFYYPWIQLAIGTAQLQAIPSNYLDIEITTHTDDFDADLVTRALQIAVEDTSKPVIITVVPYLVIQSQADAVVGVVDVDKNKAPKFVIKNLPANSAVTLTIPGSKHPNFREILAAAQ